MNTLRTSPFDARRCGHASDANALDQGGSRARRGDSQQGSSSGARGEPSACAVQPGSRRATGADHGRAWGGANGGVAYPGGVFARRCGSGGLRRRAIGPAAPVRHRRRGPSDCVGVHEPAQGPATLDDHGTRAGRPPGAWPERGEPRNRSAHAQKTISSPGAG